MEFTDYSNSFNEYIYLEIGSNGICLDIGCSSGSLGRELIAKKYCIVDGCDVHEQAIELAVSNGYRAVELTNLDNIDPFLGKFNLMEYDYIICADILEHLIEPEKLLRGIKEKSKKNAKIIISVPNVAFVMNRLNLLFGQWNYTEYGTLDKTHLKFYTIETVKKLVEDAGLRIEKLRPYNQFKNLKLIDPLLAIFPGLLAYQILLVASNPDE